MLRESFPADFALTIPLHGSKLLPQTSDFSQQTVVFCVYFLELFIGCAQLIFEADPFCHLLFVFQFPILNLVVIGIAGRTVGGAIAI